MSEVTLGGYMSRHDRAPAFGGSDGRSYSVALWVDDETDDSGRLPGALLFIRWSLDQSEPDGHVETDWLVHGHDEADVRSRLGALSLFDVKELLEECLVRSATPESP